MTQLEMFPTEDLRGKGAKYDSGKLLAGIVIEDFPRALTAIAAVATMGAEKYSRSSWQDVPEAMTRYADAMVRHLLAHQTEPVDEESGLLHFEHFAWNVLALLELIKRHDDA